MLVKGTEDGIEASRSSTFVVKDAFNTTRTGVFAAGDAVSGPATVIQAVAQGNLVAVAVDQWLQTGQMVKPRYETARPDIVQLTNLDDYANARRPSPGELTPEERFKRKGFSEVEMLLDEDATREECKRCLRCDLEWLERIGQPLP